MNLNYTEEDNKFRNKIKEFIKSNLSQEVQKKALNGKKYTKDEIIKWQKALFREGFFANNWPKEYGGCEWTPMQRYIFDQETALSNTPEIIPFGVTMVGPVIIEFGTDNQKERFLPKILNSEHWWCQGYSEPGSGSDLASLQTKAILKGNNYIVSGTKTWTTLAQYADWMFCLVRTKKDGKPQEGISFLLIDMKSNGIKVEGVCDSFKEKTIDPFFGLNTFHTPELPKHFKDARFIIASQHVQECADQLTGLGYKSFFSPLSLIKNYDVNKHKHSVSSLYMKNRLDVCRKSHELYFDKDKTYMRSLDVMITTRCSLKCRNCSNLMQYYKNPENTDGSEIIKALNILHNNVDFISEYRVIGGEPLMNRDWASIVNNLTKKMKIQKYLYTLMEQLPQKKIN